jgi:hypothetical protein
MKDAFSPGLAADFGRRGGGLQLIDLPLSQQDLATLV